MGERNPLRIEGMSPGRLPFRFIFDGREFEGLDGDTVAAALWAAGERTLRSSPEAGAARGAFCFMGSCQECVVETDAGVVESCRLAATPGLVVRRITYVDRNH